MNAPVEIAAPMPADMDFPPNFSFGGDYWFAYGPKAHRWIKARYVGLTTGAGFELRESQNEFVCAAKAAGFVVEGF